MLNEDLLRHRISNQTMHPDPNRNAEIRRARPADVARCSGRKGNGFRPQPVFSIVVHTPAMNCSDGAQRPISVPDRLRRLRKG